MSTTTSTMTWHQLLSEGRLGAAQPPRPRHPTRSPFMVDYDRIVFSSAFRRLQDKTQVHPLPQSDYVRRRLTHSLEVSCIGRSLGIEIGYFLRDEGALPDGIPPEDLGFIVAAACLAHDIGNPPFGHSGEEAIGGWFAEARAGRFGAILEKDLSAAEHLDLERFEGNAQGFRILTRLQMYQDDGGLRLTRAGLGAVMKYPCLAAAPGRQAHKGRSTKKFGAFQAERAWLEEVAAGCGLIPRGDGAWARHPLAFLMEAADDIAYAVVDLEDGMKLDYLDGEETVEALLALAGDKADRKRLGADMARNIEYLRASAIGNLVEACAAVFRANHDDILAGRYDRALVDDTSFAAAHEHATKELAAPRIFRSPEVTRAEAKGFHVVHDLLDRFAGAVLRRAERADGRPTPLDERHLRLVPRLPGPEAGLYPALLAVTDYVSGMTDGYAVKLRRDLGGM